MRRAQGVLERGPGLEVELEGPLGGERLVLKGGRWYFGLEWLWWVD